MSSLAIPAASKFARVPTVLPTLSLAPALWLRSDGPFELATGVKTWYDRSGNNRHATQAAGALQPALIASAVNGRASVRFDTSGSQLLATAGFTLNNPMSAWLVAKSITYGTGGVKDIWMDGATAGAMVIGSVISGGYAISSGASLNYAASVANGAYAYTGNIYGTSAVIRVNGVQQQAGTSGTNNAGGLTLGALANGTRGSNFEIAELILLPGIPDAASITALELYLATLYGL